MANASILAAFERMWQHITTALDKKAEAINEVANTDDITDIEVTIADNTEYTYTNVTSLTMVGNNYKACGTITFGDTISAINIDGFTASAGDDINTAIAGETWEFNCYEGCIIWKNWSVV